MNRTAIEYVINPDGTPGFNWAVMTGCLHSCRDEYCYNTQKPTAPLNRFYRKNREKETGKLHIVTPGDSYPYGFDPTYYPYKLEEPLKRKKPSMIFVANAADIFGWWVPRYIIDCILNVVRQCPQHTFLLLTKNYKRLYEFEFPDNAWVGVTLTDGRKVYERMMVTGPDPVPTVPPFGCSKCGGIVPDMIKAKTRFISFEPLHNGFEKISYQTTEGGYIKVDLSGINWIVIGAESGRRAVEMRPKRDWVLTLVKSAQDMGIPVWMKDNLAPEPFNKKELIQELPVVTP